MSVHVTIAGGLVLVAAAIVVQALAGLAGDLRAQHVFTRHTRQQDRKDTGDEQGSQGAGAAVVG